MRTVILHYEMNQHVDAVKNKHDSQASSTWKTEFETVFTALICKQLPPRIMPYKFG